MKKLLVVEDDGALQQIYNEAFTREGYLVIRATTGAEAVQKAKTDLPDIVVLDIMLGGGMNGFDVLEVFKREEALSSIPIIVLTNLDTERQTALSIGASDYVVKSDTSIEEVMAKVKKHLPVAARV